MKRALLSLFLLATISFALPIPTSADGPGNTSSDKFSSEVASTWFELLYDVVKAERTGPPPAARIYGIAAVALYESVVPGSKTNVSLVGQLNGLVALPEPIKNTLHWPTVANTTLASTIVGLFPTLSAGSLANIRGLESDFAESFRSSIPRQRYDRSVAHGQALASAILSWAAGDGLSVNNNCPYVPAPVPGAWQPTPPALNPNPLQPCWGFLRPMVLTSGSECPPSNHPAFSTDNTSAFFAAAQEVYNVGIGLTAEQKTIADYWSDGPGATGTPAGHWVAIVSQFARNDELSLIEAAEAYARVGIAVHDAFIACWNAKYVFNLQRPVTYIRANIDADWSSYIVTPNFPTYTSGHSTQSGAAALALTDMFGTRSFVDTTHTDHGFVPAMTPRAFSSLNEAAAEAAVSRLYGGIHFRFDNLNGLATGQCIGQKILDRVSFGTD